MVVTLASVGIALLPSSAAASVLFDHTDPTPPAEIVSQFPADAQTQGAIAYDDFTIPPGEVWQLKHLFADGASSGPATSTDAYVQLDRNPGTPPDATTPLYAEMLTPGPEATYPNLDLGIGQAGTYPPGNYWISVRAQLPLGPSSNKWFWQANDEQFGDLAVWQENGAYGSGCTLPPPKPRNTVCDPGTGPDQSFRIEGERLRAEIEVVKTKALSNGRLQLTLELPSCCGLVAKSKQMDGHYNQGLRDVGRFVLTLKPKPKTRRRLDGGEDVTATVKLRTNPLLAGLPGELDFPAVKVVRKLKP
jgi:hypothetical protein